MTRVGFVLLTHSDPDQVLKLSRVLNGLYDFPPIVCHHDFAQCALDKSLFSANVSFVEPHFPTFWGCFAIVPAALAAIRILMDGKDSPDWFYLLSGSDYPAMSADRVLSVLRKTPHDAFIDHRRITYDDLARSASAAEGEIGFSRGSYMRLAYRRYCAVAIPRPSLAKPWAFPPVGHSYLFHPRWRSLIRGPFSESFRCYAGEHWFTANSKAAEVLLSQSDRSSRLLAHLRRRECPEECFHHSMLGNSQLSLRNNNLRYIDWLSSGAWHPKTLTIEDLPMIAASGAHFARKVEYGSTLAEELDRVLGVSRDCAA